MKKIVALFLLTFALVAIAGIVSSFDTYVGNLEQSYAVAQATFSGLV